MASSETKVFGSVHEDPNFAVICSFISRYGTLLGLPDISFDALEKWIEDQRYMNDSVKDLLLKLLKRWKSSVNEDRLHQYLIKFCHTYSQVDAFEVESCGFQRCKTATKLRIIKTLLEQQFDSNAKFKEKINEVPAWDLRCLPIGRDMTGKAYWFLADKEMNIRIYCEEQDDVQNETWHIVVNDRSQLANLITTLEELNGKLDEKSRSATPSTVISESNKSEADERSQLFSIPETCESDPCATGDATKIDANGSAKPDFLLCPVKDEPPADSLIEAPPGVEVKKPDLKVEEKKVRSEIGVLPDDTKTSVVEVKLEAAENGEVTSAVKIENKTERDLQPVAEAVVKEEEEDREAKSLTTSSQSSKNSEQRDENGVKATETDEAFSVKPTCERRETTSSLLEEFSSVTNRPSSGFPDGELLAMVSVKTASEKDPEPSKQSDVNVSNLPEPESTDKVDGCCNQIKPKSTDDVDSCCNQIKLKSTDDVDGCCNQIKPKSTDDVDGSCNQIKPKSTDDVDGCCNQVKPKSTDDVDGCCNQVKPKSTDDVDGCCNQVKPKSTDDVDGCCNQVKPKSTDDVDGCCNQIKPKSTDDAVVEPVGGAENNKLAISSSSSPDVKSSSHTPVDLSGVNGEPIKMAEGGDRTEKSTTDGKTRVSVKRKRCEPVERLSSTEADTARSESDLSESASESKMRSAGEEPPSKRKRDKALRTVAERDRRSGRAKGQKRSRTPEDEQKVLGEEKSAETLVESGNKSESEVRSTEDERATTKEDCDAAATRCPGGVTKTGRSADADKIAEIKCQDGGGDVPPTDTLETKQTKLKLNNDETRVLSTTTNDDTALPETETTDAGAALEGNQDKRPAGRPPGRKGRKPGRRRKGRREEKENAADKKSDAKTEMSEGGRKKRGLKPSVNQGSEVDYEPNNKLVRPGTKDENKSESKGTLKDSACLSEDDVPLIELRRSARANKGQRKFEPLVTQEPKKRRKNATIEEEKNRKKAELEEKRLKKEAELAALAAAAKNKKKRRGKNESDDDFVPGKGAARKAKGRSRARKRGGGAGGGGGSEEEESEELEEELFEPETEEESLRFSATSSETELESDGSIYEPRGRNAKRAAAFKENSKPEVEVNDQPCSKCGRTDQPEWLLLCDQCECAYHTACLRPPLLAIPEGDWFCPPCEHSNLIAKLQEQLSEYDKKAKQNVRLIQRKERLAFVGISLSNILPVQQERRPLSKFPDLFDEEKDKEAATECEQDNEETEEEEDEDTEEEEDRSARSRNARRSEHRHHQTKRNRENWRRRKPRQRSPSERSFSEEATEDDEEDDDDEEGWTSGRRSRRQRKEISYKFEEFDELINEAIEDDVKDAKGAGNFGRGKDISNITGIRDSDNDDHGPNGKRKKRRRLTHLDSNDEEPDEDDSEEYQISEGEASSATAEEDDDTIDADEESDDWQVGRRPTRAQLRLKRGNRRSKRSHKRSSVYDDDFVVDEYDSEDDRPCPRRRRAAAQRQINYQEDSDETDASQNSRPPARKKPARRSGIYSSGSENGSGGEEKKQRRKTRGKSDDSEYVPSAGEDPRGRRGSSSAATKKTGSHKRIGSDTDEYNSSRETLSRKKGRMNNYVIESTEEEEEEEDEKNEEAEAENTTAHKDGEPEEIHEKEGSLSDAESRTSEEEEVGSGEQNEPLVQDSSVLSSSSKPEAPKATVNGHCAASSVNGNTESHNNHNFSIANLLKNSDKRPAPLPRVAEFEMLDLLQTGREDSLTDVLDLVDYVTQGDPA